MNINDAFPGQYLKAADLKGRNVRLIMREVVVEDLGSGEQRERKPVLYFEKTDRGFVLNKTNAMYIADMYGPETTAWAGKTIVLYPTKVEFSGRLVDTIRVEYIPLAHRAAAMQAPLARDEPPPHVDIPDNVPPPRTNGNGSYAAAKNGVKLPMATAAGIDDEIPF